jgi:hypothetical protein
MHHCAVGPFGSPGFARAGKSDPSFHFGLSQKPGRGPDQVICFVLIGAVSLFVAEVVYWRKSYVEMEACQKVLAGAGQETFDEIAVPHANGRDSVARIGPGLSLRFTDGNQLAGRLAATAALRL